MWRWYHQALFNVIISRVPISIEAASIAYQACREKYGAVRISKTLLAEASSINESSPVLKSEINDDEINPLLKSIEK